MLENEAGSPRGHQDTRPPWTGKADDGLRSFRQTGWRERTRERSGAQRFLAGGMRRMAGPSPGESRCGGTLPHRRSPRSHRLSGLTKQTQF